MTPDESGGETSATAPKPKQVPVHRGYLSCFAAAMFSVVLPGLGHLVVRARFRRAVISTTALSAVATIVALIILLPVSGSTDLAEIIANRVVFVGLAVVLLVLAATRLWTALDSAWIARPPTGSKIRIAALLTTAVVVVSGVARQWSEAQ